MFEIKTNESGTYPEIYVSFKIRSNQKDEKLVCQECGKLYIMRKHYQNHLETKHGSKHQTKSQRTDDMHQQRKKRSGRNCASKAMNAEVGQCCKIPNLIDLQKVLFMLAGRIGVSTCKKAARATSQESSVGCERSYATR